MSLVRDTGVETVSVWSKYLKTRVSAGVTTREPDIRAAAVHFLGGSATTPPLQPRFRHAKWNPTAKMSGLKLRGERRCPDQLVRSCLTHVANGSVSSSWRIFDAVPGQPGLRRADTHTGNPSYSSFTATALRCRRD
jgi:hypothetical protein